jgi:hypothetical protein
MERRLYFIVGDLLVNLLAGAIVGASCALIFSPGWNMWVAMALGMPLGMFIALPLAILCSTLFGAMEVMLPVMITSMVVSMVVPMTAAMAKITVLHGIVIGCWLALASLAVCYLANAYLRRRTSQWIS